MTKGGLDSLHSFADKSLRRRALTHASAGGDHNERLEWLGDAINDFLIGILLFARHPDLAEGDLTLARSFLVGDKHLASLARGIGLQKHVVVGAAVQQDGGGEQDSILAGAMEAYIAAIYLDGGINAAQQAAEILFSDSLSEADSLMQSGGLKDDKTRLQEYLQKRGKPPPQYQVLDRGQISRRPFCVAECSAEEHFAAAAADNQRAAEQLAAACIVAKLTAKSK